MAKQAIPRERVDAVLAEYDLRAALVSAEPYGSGHINDTFMVMMDQAGAPVRYILQRINHRIFKDPVRLMDNIQRVTAHVAGQMKGHYDAARRVLTVVPTRSGQALCQDAEGDFWRIYLFIEKARTYDIIDRPERAAAAARAFGFFIRYLEHFPAQELHETIPFFHHTPRRLADLQQAVADDLHNRAASVKQEIAFFLQREADAHCLRKLYEAGQLPLRVTHNDCKVNNVMLDDQTGEGVCVIDLDTVMPGLSLYDFGDMVRTATSPAAEDEKDLSRVGLHMPLFRALLEGFIEGAGAVLTPSEVDYLSFAGKLITLETGMRFLTDFLAGDVYFKTARPGHNMDRCRTQMKLVESMEQQEVEMSMEVVRRVDRFRAELVG
jgi:aminoglycoside phosphotransferase (APT) family kinase protein